MASGTTCQQQIRNPNPLSFARSPIKQVTDSYLLVPKRCILDPGAADTVIVTNPVVRTNTRKANALERSYGTVVSQLVT
jgi:hypothetical protein